MGTCCINSRIQELGLFKKQKHDKILHCFPAGPGIWTECGIVSRMLPLDLLVFMQRGFRQNIQCGVKILMDMEENFLFKLLRSNYHTY